MYKLMFRFLFRFARDGELALLLFSIIIASGTVTGIGLFVNRISNTVMQEAANFLAADAKINGPRELKQEWYEQAHALDLETGSIIGFSSMAFAGDSMQISNVRAVSYNYPLHGEVLLSTQPFGDTYAVTSGPKPGEAWIASRVFSALGVAIGDSINIGEKSLIVSAALIQEPDAAPTNFGFSPKILMNIEDVAATQVIQVGSRIGHAMLIAGDSDNIAKLKTAIEPEFGDHYSWKTPEESNQSVTESLDRSERFLLLAGSLSVILAGVAVALAAHRFSQRQQNNVALLKSFGMTPKEVSKLYIGVIVLVGLAGMAAGILLGWSLHFVLIYILRDAMPPNLASASGYVYLTGALTACLSLLAFCVPPLMKLRNIAPSQIIRGTDLRNVGAWQSSLFGSLAIVVLVFSYSQSLYITGIAVAALLIMALLGGLAITGLVAALNRSTLALHGYYRIGISNLQRNRFLSVLQIFVFSMVFLLLLVLTQIRTGMLDQWSAELPKDAPNHFVFNVFTDELEAIQSEFKKAGVKSNSFYPMTRGRVVSVNGRETSEILEGKEVRNDYERELNLTWSQMLGADNKILEGQWWGELPELESSESSEAQSDNSSDETSVVQASADTAQDDVKLLASVEEEYAKGLELKIGDTLEVSVAGQKFLAEVSSFRSVQWNSMNPNFYIIFDQSFSSGMGENWLSSFYLEKDQKNFLTTLGKAFPTITLIELDQTIDQINAIIDRVTLAIEFILMLVLSAALLVMLTSVQATLDDRRRESALLRSFGASRKFVRQVLTVEFIAIGLLSGIFSVMGAEACLFLVEQKLFNMTYSPHYWMWWIAPLLSIALVTGVGMLSTIRISYVPPLRVLRV